MEKQIQLSIGSVIGWYGKKYKIVPDGQYFGCGSCALFNECNEIPFFCSVNGEYIHFEEIGGAK